jgi:hypothetical protein
MPPLGPEKSYLKEIYELSKDNNRMLHRMRRSSIFWGIVKFLWWALILIVLPAGVYYYYVMPIVDQAQNTYQTVQQGADQVQNFQKYLLQLINDMLAKFGFGSSTPSQ